jgi:hypothetical protein
MRPQNGIRFVLACLLTLASGSAFAEAPPAPEQAGTPTPAPAAGQLPPPMSQQDLDQLFSPKGGQVVSPPLELRKLHSGGLFLLQTYSGLDALIGAANVEGRSENQAFLIGASSALVPGTGQLINGDYASGGLMLFAAGMSAATLGMLPPERRPRAGLDATWLAYQSALAVRNGIMAYAMLQAANTHYRNTRDRSASMWTGTASILPGAGQAINREWWAAAGLFVTWSLSVVAAASLESQVFTTRDLPGMVTDSEAVSWSVSCLPEGVALFVSRPW